MNKRYSINILLLFAFLFVMVSSTYANEIINNNWQGAFGQNWKNSNGLCWRNSNWSKQTASKKCDGAYCQFFTETNFAFDDYSIQLDAKKVINQILNLSSNINISKIISIGHTDAIGKDSYNKRLSELRADSVKDYLLNHGLPENLISTLGKGSIEPKASNESVDGRAENRRVEINIIGIHR